MTTIQISFSLHQVQDLGKENPHIDWINLVIHQAYFILHLSNTLWSIFLRMQLTYLRIALCGRVGYFLTEMGNFNCFP